MSQNLTSGWKINKFFSDSQRFEPKYKSKLLSVMRDLNVKMKQSKISDGVELYTASVPDPKQSKDALQSLSDIYHQDLYTTNKR